VKPPARIRIEPGQGATAGEPGAAPRITASSCCVAHPASSRLHIGQLLQDGDVGLLFVERMLPDLDF